MNKLILLVILLLVAVGVLGYTQGWFNLAKDDKGQVKGISFDMEKFTKDKEAAKQYLANKKKAAADKLADLRAKHKEAKGDDKAKLDKEISELTKTIDDLEKSEKELDEKDEAKLEALHKKITEMLQKAKK